MKFDCDLQWITLHARGLDNTNAYHSWLLRLRLIILGCDGYVNALHLNMVTYVRLCNVGLHFGLHVGGIYCGELYCTVYFKAFFVNNVLLFSFYTTCLTIADTMQETFSAPKFTCSDRPECFWSGFFGL